MDSFLSVVYQITQACPFDCDICLRRYEVKEKALTRERRREMVDILKSNKLGRLNITGGEPTILGEELHEFLEYVHNKQIHTSLTTTGFRLTKEKLQHMDQYLDHIMISVRSLDKNDWKNEYGDTKFTYELFDTVLSLLNWAKSMSMITEVNTVVHQENTQRVIDLGWQLLRINPNIVWRVDEYYGMGIKEKERGRFEVTHGQFKDICDQVARIFDGKFREIIFTTVNQRENSPGFLITHTGDLVMTNHHIHTSTNFNVLDSPTLPEFKMLRSWADYKKVCRDWGWGDFDSKVFHESP